MGANNIEEAWIKRKCDKMITIYELNDREEKLTLLLNLAKNSVDKLEGCIKIDEEYPKIRVAMDFCEKWIKEKEADISLIYDILDDEDEDDLVGYSISANDVNLKGYLSIILRVVSYISYDILVENNEPIPQFLSGVDEEYYDSILEDMIKYPMFPHEELKSSVADIMLNTYNKVCKNKVLPEQIEVGKNKIYTQYIYYVGYVLVIKEKGENTNYYITKPVAEFKDFIPLAWKYICNKYNKEAYDENKEYNTYYREIMDSYYSEEITKARTFKPKNREGITYNMGLYYERGMGPLLYISSREAPPYGFQYYDRGVWMLGL